MTHSRVRSLLSLLSLLSACGTEPPAVPPDTSPWPAQLSAWGLFEGSGATQVPVAGVIPYHPVSPLFSDYTSKHRFMRIPDGAQITYDDLEMWGYPIDTVLVKTFGYPIDPRTPEAGEHLIETRLLWHRADGWDAMTYVWNDAQTDAMRTVAGKTTDVTWLDDTGASRTTTYRVPNTNQCRTCHAGEDLFEPLGPRTRQLNSDFDYGSGPENQIDHLAALGLLNRTPPATRVSMVDPLTNDPSVPTEARARAYLDANCAHCHRAGGRASSSGLYIAWDMTDPARLGICKTPPAAGRGTCGLNFDIVPGDPTQSIMICRFGSTDPEVHMPEIGSSLVHAEALALLTQWISEMPPVACVPP